MFLYLSKLIPSFHHDTNNHKVNASHFFYWVTTVQRLEEHTWAIENELFGCGLADTLQLRDNYNHYVVNATRFNRVGY